MSMFVIVHGAWGSPAEMEPVVAPLESAGHIAIRSYLEQTQRPQGIAALPQKWSGDLPTSGRRTYVVTTADTLVPPEAQRAMAASAGAPALPTCWSPPAADRAFHATDGGSFNVTSLARALSGPRQ